MTPPAAPSRDRVLAWVGLAITSVMLVASLWSIELLPMHDGPQHIYMGHLSEVWDDPAWDLQRWLDRGGTITSLGFHVLFVAFDRLMDWRPATMAALTVAALLQAWAFFAFARRANPGAPWVGVIGAAAAVPWSMYMGFLSFTLATALHWLVLALCVVEGAWSLRRRAVLSLLLLGAAVAHIFAGALTGVFVLVFALVRVERSERLRELGRVVLMGLPAFLVAVGIALTLLGPQTDMYNVVPWDRWWNRFTVLPRMYVPGPAWRWGGAWVLAAIGCVGAARLARESSIARAVLGSSLVGIFVAIALPLTFAGWQLFPPRLLPVALTPLWAFVATGRERRGPGVALKVLALGWTLAAVGWTYTFHQRLDAQFASAFSAFDSGIDRRGAVRFQVILDPKFDPTVRHFESEAPFYLPMVNLGLLYATEQGGFTPYFFGHFAAMHPYHRRDGVERQHPPFPSRYYFEQLARAEGVERRGIAHQLAATSAAWDDVVVYGNPAEVDVWVRRGFVVDFRSDDERLLLAHFRGCPVAVDVVADAPLDAPMRVEFGWTPVLLPHWGATLPPGAAPEGGRFHLPLPGTPCGATWVRVLWDRDGSGDWSPGDDVCEGTDAEGRFAFETPLTGATLTCVRRPAAGP